MVESAVVIGTRKHLKRQTCTNCFCHRKSTAAAAYNLLVAT